MTANAIDMTLPKGNIVGPNRGCPRTTNRGACITPFEYNGKIYEGCTTDDLDNGEQASEWCAVEVDDNGVLESWYYCACATCAQETVNEERCIFPFEWVVDGQLQTFDSCTSYDNDGSFWCPTSVSGGEIQSWNNCSFTCDFGEDNAASALSTWVPLVLAALSTVACTFSR
eukprot:CAMPEP_0205820566 /NCGR_PEP_ID=MMETSP0206-20130828/3223_1 /ASSEMBLY_ACC=CAM_ASM_000279 /TAXON_ID=36767 /ORGANISM="Euplotes focardii, Strain TN1" /LENGTH=170 /DNA_ID=CAMNT_0053115403 /DNA_START=62 /DNA_END=574 /DNA_ORIENTATION=-